MKIALYSFSLLLVVVFYSCRPTQEKKIENLVREWQGKTIVFPKNSIFTVFGRDTVDFAFASDRPKVLMYVDTLGCISCKLQLAKWKEWIRQVDSLAPGKVQFVFYLNPKDYKEIRYLLKRDGFGFPVCLDRKDELNRLNGFPSEPAFQTFLLDKDNRIQLIGNPIHNLAVKTLYVEQITGRKNASGKGYETTAEAVSPQLSVGTIPLSKPKKATFQLKNTGDRPLVILDATTTCGCVKASFDKQPAPPGQTRSIEIEITPDKTGFFNEVITVKCNTKQCIQLTINGKAE